MLPKLNHRRAQFVLTKIDDIAISVVTLIELAHGAARADTSQRKEKRQQFIQELLTALPIHPVIALRAGRYRWTSVSVTPWFSRR